jgi:hypothetical protein
VQTSRLRPRTGLAALLAAVALTAACGEAPERETASDSGSDSGASARPPRPPRSSAAGGPRRGSQEEGTLNVIALPPTGPTTAR